MEPEDIVVQIWHVEKERWVDFSRCRRSEARAFMKKQRAGGFAESFRCVDWIDKTKVIEL